MTCTEGLRAFKTSPDAGDGAAGAHAGDEDVDAAVGVVPDLLGRGDAVHLGVGRVLELLGDEVARVAGGEFVGLGDRAGHPVGSGGQEQFRTVAAQQGAAFLAHRLGHGEGALVALGGRHHRQRDTGVAAGGLQDDGVGSEQPGLPRRR